MSNLAQKIKNEKNPVGLARAAFENRLLVVVTHPFYNEAYNRWLVNDAFEQNIPVSIKLGRQTLTVKDKNLCPISNYEGVVKLLIGQPGAEDSHILQEVYIVKEGKTQILISLDNINGESPKEKMQKYIDYRRAQAAFLRACGPDVNPFYLIWSEMFDQTLEVFNSARLVLSDKRILHSEFGEITRLSKPILKEEIEKSNGIMLTGMYTSDCVAKTRQEIVAAQARSEFKNVPIFEAAQLIL